LTKKNTKLTRVKRVTYGRVVATKESWRTSRMAKKKISVMTSAVAKPATPPQGLKVGPMFCTRLTVRWYPRPWDGYSDRASVPIRVDRPLPKSASKKIPAADATGKNQLRCDIHALKPMMWYAPSLADVVSSDKLNSIKRNNIGLINCRVLQSDPKTKDKQVW
jgi:hypothetical protein